MGSADINLFFSDGFFPRDGSIERLKEIANMEGVDEAIAVLPEVLQI